MKDAYVCGFLLTFDSDKFLLIDKGKKDQGKAEGGFITNLRWCGIGGQIAENEFPHDAMAREFQEETGYEIKRHRWHCFMIKEYQSIKIYMYCSFCSPDEMQKIQKLYPDSMGPEGEIQIHDMVNIYFDPELYTHDIPYLMNMIIRESRRGFITKLDPEGVNSRARQMP
jgi:8-oxo-dGTP pyrophosphatase MutT (NUDIX family)